MLQDLHGRSVYAKGMHSLRWHVINIEMERTLPWSNLASNAGHRHDWVSILLRRLSDGEVTQNNIHLHLWMMRSEAGILCIGWATNAKNNLFCINAWVFFYCCCCCCWFLGLFFSHHHWRNQKKKGISISPLSFDLGWCLTWQHSENLWAPAAIGSVSEPGLWLITGRARAALRSSFWLMKQREADWKRRHRSWDFGKGQGPGYREIIQGQYPM